MHRPMIDNSVNGVRSKQNLSCNWTGSADFGRLIPIHWEELIAGDHVITCRPRIEVQLLPLASSTFGKMSLYCHYFIVPLRQLWDSWYDFWSQTGVNKGKTAPYFTPYNMAYNYQTKTANDAERRGIFKHWTSLGLNPFFTVAFNKIPTSDLTPISYFPFAAYNKIWWDFYRDPEVLRDESKSSYLYSGDINGNMTTPDTNFILKYLRPHVRSIKNCWISDLFASQGDVLGDSLLHPFPIGSPLSYKNGADESASVSMGGLQNFGTDTDVDTTYPVNESSRMNRLIESLTRLSERLSLSGKREIEALFARYGVKPKWSQMNLARYVGGAKQDIMVDDLISTADTVSFEQSMATQQGSPLGFKAGTGYCALRDLNIEVSVDEPSILMGIVSIMPAIHFVQGLSKKWQRREITTFFQDSLQYTGQVAVARREVAKNYKMTGNTPMYDDSKDAETFAFCDPYYDYKMGLDVLAGDFMTYHNADLPASDEDSRSILYMQSMEQYIDFPTDRQFNLDNMLVDGDKYNKIFNYLGGSVNDDVDDHFWLCVDKDVIIDRPMEGFAIPTLETTADPHKKTQHLSSDKML